LHQIHAAATTELPYTNPFLELGLRDALLDEVEIDVPLVVVQEVTDAVAGSVFRVFSDAGFAAVFPEEIAVQPCLSFLVHGYPH